MLGFLADDAAGTVEAGGLRGVSLALLPGKGLGRRFHVVGAEDKRSTPPRLSWHRHLRDQIVGGEAPTEGTATCSRRIGCACSKRSEGVPNPISLEREVVDFQLNLLI